MPNGSHAKGVVCSGYIAIVVVIVIKFKRPEAVNNILRIKGQRHSSFLAWKIPWTEEPGGLQSMGLERVEHDRAQSQQQRKSVTMT